MVNDETHKELVSEDLSVRDATGLITVFNAFSHILYQAKLSFLFEGGLHQWSKLSLAMVHSEKSPTLKKLNTNSTFYRKTTDITFRGLNVDTERVQRRFVVFLHDIWCSKLIV